MHELGVGISEKKKKQKKNESRQILSQGICSLHL